MFESSLIALLGPLVDGRIRWDELDDGLVVADGECHIMLEMVSGRAVNYVGDDVPDVAHTRLQVSVWSKRRADTNAMMRTVERTIRLANYKAVEVIGGLATMRQNDIDTYGARQQFGIWYSAL